MKDSYLFLDEKMRYAAMSFKSRYLILYVCIFLNCSSGKKIPGRGLLEHGVHAALQDDGWETEDFIDRDGIYEWARPMEW